MKITIIAIRTGETFLALQNAHAGQAAKEKYKTIIYSKSGPGFGLGR